MRGLTLLALLLNLWPTPGPGHAQYGGGGGSTISASFAAQPLGHSTQCIAPCLVLFDAQATTDSSVTRPFHELDYRWSFNDSAPGTGVTGYDLNYARGPLASHMFETPGTYSADLTVCNPSGDCAATSSNVVVQDPLTYFSGSIYCVSTGTNFTDWCPSGATQVGSQTNFDTALETTPNVDGAKSWVVLNCGESWQITGMTTLYGSNAPGLISSRSTSGGLCGTLPVINLDATEDVFDLYNASEGVRNVKGRGWTISAIEIAGPNTAGGDGWGNMRWVDNVVASRIYIHDITGSGFIMDGDSEFESSYIGLWGSTVRNGTNHADSGSMTFWHGEKLIVQNNTLDNNYAGEFPIRFVGFKDTVVADNIMQNPGVTDRNLIQLRCTDPYDRICSGTVVSRNLFIGHATGPSSSYSHIRVCRDSGCHDAGPGGRTNVTDLIIESNMLRFSVASTVDTQKIIAIAGANVTVRNNILDLRGIDASAGTIAFVWGDQEPLVPVGDDPNNPWGTDEKWDALQVFNNTVYTNSTSTFNFIWCERTETRGVDHKCYNNLFYAPNQTGTVTATSGTNWTAATNIDAATSPFDFVDTPPTIYTSVYSDFDLKTGDTLAIDQGTDIDATFANSLFMDAWAHCRTGTIDIGAHEYGASTCY